MPPYHITIDGCCLGRRKTGNETYLRGLLQGLKTVASPDQWRITVLTTSHYTQPRDPFFHWHEIPLGNFITRNFATIPRTLEKLRPHLYHAIYWTRFYAMPVPVILMVHDLSYVSFPQGYPPHHLPIYRHLIRASARRAHHLLTVSEFSKQELIRHWAIPAHHITVTYNGVNPAFHPPSENSPPTTQPPHPTSPPYILYVGNLHPRKNLVRLLQAFVHLRQTTTLPHRLKIVGQVAWMAHDIFATVRAHRLQDQVDFTGYVTESDLIHLYQHAAVTVYPSLYEGFGLPVLEAMACGCPVVSSATTSIPEIAGDAAVLVDPYNPRAIAEGICRILQNPDLAATLRQKGLAQAQKFTWTACARATLTAYQKAL
ncbi:MAG: glycosyltransferase family 4 protein, partial [Methylacidiphilales bacterium]|nr:glycosyltransferase family 4 protein [Candidatus Methylacidiphilales bacterium]